MFPTYKEKIRHVTERSVCLPVFVSFSLHLLDYLGFSFLRNELDRSPVCLELLYFTTSASNGDKKDRKIQTQVIKKLSRAGEVWMFSFIFSESLRSLARRTVTADVLQFGSVQKHSRCCSSCHHLSLCRD